MNDVIDKQEVMPPENAEVISGVAEHYTPPEQIEFDLSMARLDLLATVMDDLFIIPGTKVRFGIDSFLGLIPVIGDTITGLASAFVLKEAKRLGVPAHLRWKMSFNIFIDWLIGIVPLIGDLFDLGFKANRKNVKIIRDHFSKLQ